MLVLSLHDMHTDMYKHMNFATDFHLSSDAGSYLEPDMIVQKICLLWNRRGNESKEVEGNTSTC